MRKTLERCNKAIKRLGNEGFSLVELIIVVAIMVALVAVLAPQYFQYVEKSRISVDISAADSILSAAKVVAIDPEYYEDAKDGFTVTWDTEDEEGPVTVVATGKAEDSTSSKNLTAAIQAAVGANIPAKSKFATTGDGKDGFSVTANVGKNGEFIFTVDNANWADAMDITNPTLPSQNP